MTKDLKSLTIKELIGIHNGLNPDKPLSAWKRKASILADRIEVLRKETKAPPKQSTKKTKTTATTTIRSTAIGLLCHVAYHENRDEKPGEDNTVKEDHPRARSVGIPYNEIIDRIKEEFPDCQTTVACLRWYSVKIRVEEHGYEGLKLPQRRPRAKPTAS